MKQDENTIIPGSVWSHAEYGKRVVAVFIDGRCPTVAMLNVAGTWPENMFRSEWRFVAVTGDEVQLTATEHAVQKTRRSILIQNARKVVELFEKGHIGSTAPLGKLSVNVGCLLLDLKIALSNYMKGEP